jgi:hypothetical protein
VRSGQGSARLAVEPAKGAACLCRDPDGANQGTIAGHRFNPKVCAPFPTGELLSTDNAVCNISSYGGGLLCCAGGNFLLDADQEVPEPVDTFQIKYRFYYEDYTNQSNHYRVWWSTEATNNEYDVPKSSADCLDAATDREKCVHQIKSVFTGRDFLSRGNGCMVNSMADSDSCLDADRIAQQDGGYFRLVHAAAHCHAPACMSVELWNDDTGELLCRNEPSYGDGSGPHQVKGYIMGIPPCVWGRGSSAGGGQLREAPRLHLDSNLSTIKRANNTNGHWGVMALWQNRAAYDWA